METKIDRDVDVREVWRSTLAILKDRVPEPSFRTWFESTRLSEIKGTNSKMATAMVVVPSSFAAEWLQRRYGRVIADALKMCLAHPAEVAFTVEAPPSHRAIRALDGLPHCNAEIYGYPPERVVPVAVGQSAPLHGAATQTQAKGSNAPGRLSTTLHSRERLEVRGQPGLAGPPAAAGAPEATQATPIPVLNPRYTFDRFLVGRGNQLGASVARRVAEQPGAAYNPLFIYGFRGVGKTHLLQAIGNDAHTRAGLRVMCISALLFDQPSAASRLATPDAFRSIDLLLVDDLHLIAGAGGRAAQRPLAALVEGMLGAGKGVVVTATQPPDSMLALNDALRSRLNAGIVVAIELPDAEMRLRMVSQLALDGGVRVPQTALELLASTGKTMAEICTAWERVSARCLQASAVEGTEEGAGEATERTRTMRVEDVQGVLAELNRVAPPRAHVSPERIIDQVASYFDLEINEMCSASRHRSVMLPRQVAMYLIREQTDRSYEWIAHRFAKQDHTTAMHSCARIAELMETNLEVRQMVLELRQIVFGEHQRSRALQLAG
jgi:chromosomal replication initiator protein